MLVLQDAESTPLSLTINILILFMCSKLYDTSLRIRLSFFTYTQASTKRVESEFLILFLLMSFDSLKVTHWDQYNEHSILNEKRVWSSVSRIQTLVLQRRQDLQRISLLNSLHNCFKFHLLLLFNMKWYFVSFDNVDKHFCFIWIRCLDKILGRIWIQFLS